MSLSNSAAFQISPLLPEGAPPQRSGQTPVPARQMDFLRGRGHMLAAFRGWLVTSPEPGEVLAEIDATARLLRDMFQSSRRDGA